MTRLLPVFCCLMAAGLPAGAGEAKRGVEAPGKAFVTRSYEPAKSWTEKSYSGKSFESSRRAEDKSLGQKWEPREDGRAVGTTSHPATFNSKIYDPPEPDSKPQEKPYRDEKLADDKAYREPDSRVKVVSISPNPTDANVKTPFEKSAADVKSKIYEARGKSTAGENPLLAPRQDIREHKPGETVSTAVEGKGK